MSALRSIRGVSAPTVVTRARQPVFPARYRSRFVDDFFDSFGGSRQRSGLGYHEERPRVASRQGEYRSFGRSFRRGLGVSRVHSYDFVPNRFIAASTAVFKHRVAQYWIPKSFITNPSTKAHMFHVRAM